MKNLMNLKNAKVLNKREQKEVKGGGYPLPIAYCEDPDGYVICRPGYICVDGQCVRA